jgi:uncharacterized protein
MNNYFLNYIGTALEYPLECKSGSAKIVTGKELINASINQILLVDVGSLPHNPYFGSNLFRLLFEPLTTIVQSLGATFIAEALKLWEARIEVINISSGAKNEIINQNGLNLQSNLVNFEITYRIIATNETTTFVFPFYRDLQF